MKIHLNGAPREVRAGTSLQTLATEVAGSDLRGMAIARNGAITPKARWEQTALEIGDRIEIVRAVAGG